MAKEARLRLTPPASPGDRSIASAACPGHRRGPRLSTAAPAFVGCEHSTACAPPSPIAFSCSRQTVRDPETHVNSDTEQPYSGGVDNDENGAPRAKDSLAL